MKSYRIVPHAPDDETPVDFPDETSLRGDRPGGWGTPGITTPTSAADKLMLLGMPVALSGWSN